MANPLNDPDLLPGWPFQDESGVPRMNPFTCLVLMLLLVLVLALGAPLLWGQVFAGPTPTPQI